jgi:hypothetical protein
MKDDFKSESGVRVDLGKRKAFKRGRGGLLLRLGAIL